ncbi:hypothetical protein RP20_CCG006719 [Aedes albopictus]|nr:hypothetical protein RP20_CCG006719 [Aedes albopictus]
MSRGPKRNVAFIKPDEPDFLKRMKAQICYKEGPTVDEKRRRIENLSDSDDDEREEREDEKPQVVVLKEGDLTAEEAAEAKKVLFLCFVLFVFTNIIVPDYEDNFTHEAMRTLTRCTTLPGGRRKTGRPQPEDRVQIEKVQNGRQR